MYPTTHKARQHTHQNNTAMTIGIGYCIPNRKPGINWSSYWKTQMKFSEGTVLDEMDALTGWVKGGTGGAMELNEVEKFSGTGSIKLTSGSGTQVRMSKTIVRDFSIDDAISFKLKAYAHTDPATTIAGVIVFASTTSSLTDYFTRVWGPTYLSQNEWVDLDVRATSCLSVDNGYAGWTVASGSPNWANITYIRIVVSGAPGQVGSVSFDAIEHGAEYRPTVMITFDDRNISDFTRAYPYLKAKGMVATSYILSTYLSDSYMSAAQLQTLNANKWDIANHTDDHTDLSTLATEAEVIARIEACETYLNGLGLTRASKHIAYPYANTNATVLAAMASYGALTGRGSGNGYNGTMTYKYNYPYTIATKGGALGNGDNVVVNQAMLAHIVKYKTNLTLLYHSLADDDDFAAFCTEIDSIEALGIQTLTISEFYRLATEDITVYHK